MIIIARISDKKILSRYEAWDANAFDNANQYIKSNNLSYEREEITLMGDMIIWVA